MVKEQTDADTTLITNPSPEEPEEDFADFEMWENHSQTPEEWVTMLTELYPEFPGDIKNAAQIMWHFAKGCTETEEYYKSRGLTDVPHSLIATPSFPSPTIFSFYHGGPAIVGIPLSILSDLSTSPLDEVFHFKNPIDGEDGFVGTIAEYVEDEGREETLHNINTHYQGHTLESVSHLSGKVGQAIYDSNDSELRTLVPRIKLAQKAGYNEETINVLKKRLHQAREVRAAQKTALKEA